MVEVRLFQKDDMPFLIDALSSQKFQGIQHISHTTLPKIGYTANVDGKMGAAYGFLRMVEGGYAQIDTLATHTKFTSRERNEALSAVVDALLDMAKTINLKGIVCFTDNESVISRAEKLGFSVLNHRVIGKTIT
jgi:hypothetical protein